MMNQQTLWWLEYTAAGRRVQRRVLPASALGPRARAELLYEQQEEQSRKQRLEAERQRRAGR